MRAKQCAAVAISFLACLLGNGGQRSANAGFVAVMGDATPFYYLTGSLAKPPNQTFFANLLGEGTRVTVVGLLDDSSEGAHQFYSGLPGVGSVLARRPVSDSMLNGVDLLVVTMPDEVFASSEVDAIHAFLRQGGSLFLANEAYGLGPPPNNTGVINALLDALKIDMFIRPALLDVSDHFASGAQLVSHPLTDGVSGFRYGATSQVVGGAPIMFTSGGVPFASLVIIPEPALAVPLALSCCALVCWRRWL